MPRRLGQHFLRDQGALRRIVRALGLDPDSHVVEIGPGRGALTRALLDAGASVTAIEVDPELAAALPERVTGALTVVQADALAVDLASYVAEGHRNVLAGNLPYYITSPLVRQALAAGPAFERAVFLIQKEVAERIVARKGSRDYGYLSALVRLQAEPELLFTVKPGAFQPPPKVDSAAIRLTPRGGPAPDPDFVRFLEAAFRRPRKTLRNNLAAIWDKAALDRLPESGLRAQQLDVEELVDLWRRLRDGAF